MFFPRLQKCSIIPTYKKSGKEGKTIAWVSKDLLVKLKSKKGMHRQWNQGHISWEVYRNAAYMCGDKFRKTRTQVLLFLARNGEINKDFYRFLVRKETVKKICIPTTLTEK